MEIGLDDDDEVPDIREQMFHNTVREQIVSTFIQLKTTKQAAFSQKGKKKSYINVRQKQNFIVELSKIET